MVRATLAVAAAVVSSRATGGVVLTADDRFHAGNVVEQRDQLLVKNNDTTIRLKHKDVCWYTTSADVLTLFDAGTEAYAQGETAIAKQLLELSLVYEPDYESNARMKLEELRHRTEPQDTQPRKVPPPVAIKQFVFRDKILEVPHVSQDLNYCAPAAAAMVAAFHNKHIDQALLARLSSARSERHRGTSLQDLARALQMLGLDAKVSCLACDARYKHQSRDESLEIAIRRSLLTVKKEITANRPVIVAIRQRLQGAHAVVVVGFDDDERRVYYNDPGSKTPQTKAVSYEQFAEWWAYETSGVHHHRALVCRGPGHKGESWQTDDRGRSFVDTTGYAKTLAAIGTMNDGRLKGKFWEGVNTLGTKRVETRDFARKDVRYSVSATRSFATKTCADLATAFLSRNKAVLLCGGTPIAGEIRMLVGCDRKREVFYYLDGKTSETKSMSKAQLSNWWTYKTGNGYGLVMLTFD